MHADERHRRDARAIGCYFRIRNFVAGFSMTFLAVAIVLWMVLGDHGERDFGPWPYVAAFGCAVAGPMLLWQSIFQPGEG